MPPLTASAVPGPVPRGRRIGLLGGSFNPAHEGHLEISRLAIELLGLDEVWWLVSPQNPLKPTDGMAPLAERMAGAEKITKRLPIFVTDVETHLGTRYTTDTLAGLKQGFPGARFVWLMGADNLVQMHRWHRWSSIFHMVPVAVFARPTYSLRAERAKAARRFARYRIKPHRAAGLADRPAPAWVLFKRPHVPVSATGIRRRTQAADS
ncbi:MAG: nicotinate-nucleotide adenylyltransferase [Magnetovibrio sp.]|nr:nicotinate-nucleotide adenylyltransferase [Magnetovibrio sp.]